jgi:hypothetical protein
MISMSSVTLPVGSISLIDKIEIEYDLISGPFTGHRKRLA